MEEEIRQATISETRRKKLVADALALAEKKIQDGTASSQILTTIIKMGTEDAKLERIKKEYEIELLRAKTQSINAASKKDEQYEEVIAAMKEYGGAL